MKPPRHILTLLALLILAHWAGKCWLPSIVNQEVMGVLLAATGLIVTISSGILWNVFGKLDGQPPAALTASGKANLNRELSWRRKVFWWRYWFSVATAIVALSVGLVLKFTEVKWDTSHLFGLGAASFLGALILFPLAVIELSTVSETLRKLPGQLEENRRKHEMLTRLSRTNDGSPSAP